MKIIVGNQNTKWGVIIKPSSTNIYRHVLNFDSQALKDEFINDNIFPNKDYKKLLDAAEDKHDPYVDSMNIAFRVNLDEYPDETVESLLNKDICGTKDPEGNIKWWAITNAKYRASGVIEYTAELDIFFTYSITDMFSGNTMIKQAMLDRFQISKKNANKLELAIYKQGIDGEYTQIDYTNPFFNTEEFDSIKPDSLVQLEKPNKIGYSFTPHIKTNLTDDQKSRVNEILNSLVWNTLSIANPDQPKFNTFGNSRVPYYTVMWPDTPNTLQEDIEIKITIANSSGDTLTTSNKDDKIHRLLKVPTALKSSRQMSIVNPFVSAGYFSLFHNPYKANGDIIVVLSDSGNEIKSIEMKFSNISDAQDLHITETDLITNAEDAKDKLYILTVKGHGNLPKIPMPDFDYGFTTYHNPYYRGINTNNLLTNDLKTITWWNPKHEVKADFAPYKQIELKSISNNTFYYEPQYLDPSKLWFNIFNSYELSMSQVAILCHNYKNVHNHATTEENRYFLDQAGYNMPTTSTDWDEFNARHKEQFASGLLNKGIKAGIGGAMFAASAIATGGLSAIAGASLAASSGMEIKQQLAQKEDMKNAPAHVNNASTTFMFDKFLKEPYYKLTKYGLPPAEELMIQQHFFKYGYNLKNKIDNINDYLTTRYRFNYIEAPETYENIKLQVSADIKQVIDASIASGLTIWHYRNKANFKGIKDYVWNNPEMRIFNAN